MRLIDGDALLKDIRELLFTEEEPSMLLTEAGEAIHNSAIELALFEVAEAERIDAAPVVHARWIGNNVCSACIEGIRGYAIQSGYRYCPHCGAKMDGGAEDV